MTVDDMLEIIKQYRWLVILIMAHSIALILNMILTYFQSASSMTVLEDCSVYIVMWVQRLILVYVSWQFVKQIAILHNLYYKMGKLEDKEQVLIERSGADDNRDKLQSEYLKILKQIKWLEIAIFIIMFILFLACVTSSGLQYFENED